MPETDGQLYRRYLTEADEEALKSLYIKYKKNLTLFLYEMVQNMDDAEELMMDTFAILASGTARYRSREDAGFKTWLYAVAKNQARMFLRRNRRGVELHEVQVETAGAEEPEKELLLTERNAQLYKALKGLDKDYRQVLFLLYFEELKPEEISRIMKKSIKQVYNLTARGKTALKASLERMGYTWEL